MESCTIRVRMSAQDAHYGGDLVAGAHILQIFGDAATELLIRHDGDEALFAAYESVEFLAPVYAGDYIEARATLVSEGTRSRKVEFEALKVVQSRGVGEFESLGEVLDPPVVVARAVGTCVIPKEVFRGKEKTG